MNGFTSWDIMPCIPLKVTDISEEYVASIFRVKEQTKQETSITLVMLVSCLACYLTMNMGATCSSETSIDIQQTTRRYIPENITFRR
jgi:hypothetical protein